VSLEDNKAVVRRLFDAINNRALDRVPELVAPDVVDYNAVIFMQPESPGGVEEGLRMLLDGFPDLSIRIEDLIAEADLVVARFGMAGTNTGEYRGLPEPTNRRFENEAIAIFRIDEGKISEIRGTADRLSMLIQLGILPDIG
jgi:predicted ester cyclase